MRIKNLTLAQGSNHITHFPYSPTHEWRAFDNFSYSWQETKEEYFLQQVGRKYKEFINWLFEDSILGSFIILFRSPLV
jgi:hypothetical protein